MTEPRNPWDDGTQAPQGDADESTRAIRAISPEEAASRGPQGQTPPPAPQGQGQPWGQPAPSQHQVPPQGGQGYPQPAGQGYGQQPWQQTPGQQGGYPSAPAAPAYGHAGGATEDESSKGFLGSLLAAIFGWLGGLIGWFMAKDGNGWAKAQNAKAFNFALMMDVLTFLVLMAGIAIMVIGGDSSGPNPIGMMVYSLGGVVVLVRFILCLLQAFKAKKGQDVKYPFGLPILK